MASLQVSISHQNVGFFVELASLGYFSRTDFVRKDCAGSDNIRDLVFGCKPGKGCLCDILLGNSVLPHKFGGNVLGF